ncbi:GntR family transcriptional regulator [Citreimonas salinaria]|uniref:DNA-binding transcriptional regulator, GntR family n=1 Tax=Citreimonas salinaria TaxID=321339 RepID=A0A1H3L628_9RHOB|nr:GntR family transcriptional regulator [Citreimonas salinaria]SDY59325.1 DNA-binding transcriptional regulator, GntR family [Citreimonas salinaria]
MNITAADPRLPAHEQVYRQLRDMILFGDIEPGQAVTIQGLVTLLDAGMTPVREALRRLTAEGALRSLGNRRIAVPVLDAAAVSELTEARLAIEPMLASRAAGAAHPGAIAALEDTDARLDRAIARGDIPLYLRENHRFHAGLNALAEAPILTSLSESLWLRFGPSLRVVCGRIGTANLPDRHKDLTAALRAGDAEAAERAMRDDVAQGMALIAQSL